MSDNTTVANSSKKISFKPITWFILGMIFTLLASGFLLLDNNQASYQPVSTRVPASEGFKSLFNSKERKIVRTFKLENPLTVHIQKEGALAIEAGEPFVLRGIFKFTSTTKKAEIKWIIPKGLSILQGQKIETFLDVQANTDMYSEIVVISDTEENRKIHFKVGVNSGKQRFGFSAQYNTTDQESINVSKIQLKNRSNDYTIKTDNNKKLKVLK